MKEQEINDYKKAGEISIKVKEYARKLIKPDMPLLEIAQKIHKQKRKNFRVYKNFLFGGLINCEECRSKMTSVKKFES